MATSDCVVAVDLVVIRVTIETLRTRRDGEVDRVARNAKHGDRALDRINTRNDERIGIEIGAVAALINSNKEHIQSTLSIPVCCAATWIWSR